LLSFATTLVTR